MKTVPAGKYAKQYLDNQHLYSDVKDKIVYAKDVKQVLNYVEKGNTQMGFVYETDLYTNNERTDKVNEIKSGFENLSLMKREQHQITNLLKNG